MNMRTRPILIVIFMTFFSASIFGQSKNSKSKIQVLGTLHLQQLKDFNSKMLESLIDVLTNKSFDVICVEAMPTELLYDIRSRKDSAFSQVLSSYGGRRLALADSAQSRLKISFLNAKIKFNELVGKEDLSEKERVELIDLSFAVADPMSATLNYIQLQDKSSMKASSLPKRYLNELEKRVSLANEIYSLAVQIGAKQKLKKIESIDNFQDEVLLFKIYPNFIETYTKNLETFKSVGKSPVFIRENQLKKKGLETNDLLKYYRFINSIEYTRQDFEAQWKIWLTTNFKNGSDKGRYYLWEMRNLQITSNILKVIAANPDKRILVIIGSSHKGFIEKYLKTIESVEIMNFD